MEKQFEIMKLIILDRDGVINRDSDQFIKSPEEWQPIDGSLDAIAFLTQAGYTIAVATNQSGIARGYFTVETLNEMHSKMHRLVQQAGGEISGVWFCPHMADSHCSCRKPEPGMILDILARFNAEASDYACRRPPRAGADGQGQKNAGQRKRPPTRKHAGFRRLTGIFAISARTG